MRTSASGLGLEVHDADLVLTSAGNKFSGIHGELSRLSPRAITGLSNRLDKLHVWHHWAQ
jgi:hypothetical protein